MSWQPHRGLALLVALAAGSPVMAASDDGNGTAVDFDIGGVFIEDATWLRDVSALNVPEQQWQRRRATLEATLEIGSKLEFVAEGGYNNDGGYRWRDAYLDVNLPGPYQVKLGLMKPDFGLAWSSSLKNLLTPERSIALDMLDLNRAPGLLLTATPGDHRAEFGWFEQQNDDGETISSLLTRYLYRYEGDNNYWQAGFSLAHEDYDRAVYRVRSRAETTAMDNFLRTERITTEYINEAGIDLLYQHGRLLLLAEAIVTRVRSPREGDRHYEGGYAQASWMLTADAHRIGGGNLQRLNPAGVAAVELVAGVGAADIYSRANGFEAMTHSLGINFYQGDHIKVMTQVDWLDIRRGRYAGQQGLAALMRLQYRF